MKKQYFILTILCVFVATAATAQTRYVDAIYTDADIEVTSNVTYGTNIDFLTSTTSNQMNLVRDITDLKTILGTGGTIPTKYYDPSDASTDLKVTDVKMDIYSPSAAVDNTSDRPVIVYLHTGNFLPPPINGSPNGTKNDSSATVLCTEWAKRGYVAVSVNYRLGWNPLAGNVEERRGQLLNAVYRAIHDVKVAVRTLKSSASMYGIDPNKVTLYGEGTGAYVALAYETLDKNEEMELAKFRIGGVGSSYIDRTVVGEIDGSGGLLNLYGPSTVSAEVASIVTAGGALADTSWLEAGDAPMISFHCVRDPFAPFNEGTVIVPTTNEDVVDVQGANLYIQKANALGNNDAIKEIKAYDPYTVAAEANYGKTVAYIYDDIPEMTINTEVKGLFPVLLPVASAQLNNQGSPWQFWNPTSPIAETVVGEFMGQPVTAHLNSIGSNPDMSPEKGKTYIDTIVGYMCPRVALINGDIELSLLNTKEVLPSNAAKIYPNPASNVINIAIEPTYNVTSIEVLDIAGRTVKTVAPMTNASVSLEGLQTGYYFVNITTTSGTLSTKFIKQ
ncbi:MAG: T9SS type A sorting domain-containing protein [Bacteroidetes bacterium]|nr:T9SS type A sorting domain-containing protein [Bacteroidota bacterium]